MRILAVDDEPFIRELLPKFTARAGYPDVASADGGDTALAMIATKTPFDCFLLDINMPQMDGIELCRRIRALPGHERTPIIVLTAMNDQGYFERAFKAGATDYVTKPFDLVELGARLDAARQSIEVASGHRRGQPILADAAGSSTVGRSRILDRAAFGNYLAQVARGTSGDTQVFAVALSDAPAFRMPGHTVGLTTAADRIAKAIDSIMAGSGYFVTPTGDGGYIMAASARATGPISHFGAQIQTWLDATCQGDGRAQAPRIKVTLGRPTTPDASDVPEIDAVIRRAEAGLQASSAAGWRWSAPFGLFSKRVMSRPAADRTLTASSRPILQAGLRQA